MATAPGGKTTKNETDDTIDRNTSNLEMEIARLREDVARLTEQLGRTGEHTLAAAKRAASDGAEHLRVKGEAAVDALKSNADDLERQISDTVREKPITSLAIAAGIGFFFALLSRR